MNKKTVPLKFLYVQKNIEKGEPKDVVFVYINEKPGEELGMRFPADMRLDVMISEVERFIKEGE